MKSWVLAASLLIAAGGTTTVRAADLDEGPPPDRYGAYDDPRYSDMYGHPRPPAYVPPPPPRYAAPPVPPAYVYRDRDDDEDYERDYASRYAYTGPHPRYGGCVPHEEIRERLLRQGWRDFRDAEERGELATIIARRPSGRPFALTIDRCRGDVVDAQPLGEGDRHFAYGPRRWERPY